MSSSSKSPPEISIALGITIGLIASFVQSLGLTIQRKSHVLNEKCAEEDKRVEHRRPLWLLGFGIFIISNVLGSLFQIASLPVVILAPLGAVSLLWNAFFAKLLLGDVFSPYMIFGTLFIAGGAILIAIFGIVPEPTHSLDDLLLLFGRKAFIVYFSLLGAAVLIGLIVTHVVEYSMRRASLLITPPSTRSLTPRPPSPQETPATERTPLLDPKTVPSRPGTPTYTPQEARTRLLIAISYASASGILSGMCLIFAKSGVGLLVLTASGKNQFWRWESWALVGGLVVFALLQLWYLHKSLKLADPTLVCPLAFCFYNLSSIFNGLIYYDQIDALSTRNLLLVILGIVVLLAGVWAVSVQSGGGGVDVGTWDEGVDHGILEPPFTSVRSPSPHRPSRRLSLDGGEPSVSFPTTESPMHSPGLPSSPGRRRTPKRRYPSLLGNEPAGLPGGGFAIGLSPVSPGFALIPRRRVSGPVHAEARRSYSESDAGRGWPADSEEETEVPTAIERWAWLRRVFHISGRR